MRSIILAGLIFLGCTQNHEISESDKEKILELEQVFVQGWFRDNPKETVLSSFEENAVFIPHHGDKPVIGLDSLRSFFWPEGYEGIVHSFNHYPASVEGNANVAWIRGRYDVEYSWIVDNDTLSYFDAGNYVLIARKQANDEWKIATFIFNDPIAITETVKP